MRRLSLCAVAGLALLAAASALGAPSGRLPAPQSGFRRTSAGACRKASARFVAAEKELRRLKASGASAAARHQAKRKLNNAYGGVVKACSGRFDVTGVSGSFDATVTSQDHADSCSTTTDAHWTASRGPGAAFAGLVVFSVDRKGRPSFEFGAEAPILRHGTGTATVTCNESYPADNGTATCTFDLDPPGNVTIQTDTGKRLDPQTLLWFFGYDSFAYARPTNGGSCTYSGERPPTVETSIDSPSLFVSPINDGSNALEPPGITKLPAATYAHDFSLDFSGSTSRSFDSTLDSGTLNASWQMSVSLRRR
jgi:hypothetical protein